MVLPAEPLLLLRFVVQWGLMICLVLIRMFVQQQRHVCRLNWICWPTYFCVGLCLLALFPGRLKLLKTNKVVDNKSFGLRLQLGGAPLAFEQLFLTLWLSGVTETFIAIVFFVFCFFCINMITNPHQSVLKPEFMCSFVMLWTVWPAALTTLTSFLFSIWVKN